MTQKYDRGDRSTSAQRLAINRAEVIHSIGSGIITLFISWEIFFFGLPYLSRPPTRQDHNLLGLFKLSGLVYNSDPSTFLSLHPAYNDA